MADHTQTNDLVQFPHRRLTNAEWDSLFCDLSNEIRNFYRDSLTNAKAALEDIQVTGGETGQVAQGSHLRDARSAVEDLEIEQDTAHVILAYLAGQRIGFRLGLAMVAPGLAAKLRDDDLVDELIRELLIRERKTE